MIAGAAGRDFHNFNLVYRDRKDYEVVAFTATQIPNIDGRRYPAELAGSNATRVHPPLAIVMSQYTAKGAKLPVAPSTSIW